MPPLSLLICEPPVKDDYPYGITDEVALRVIDGLRGELAAIRTGLICKHEDAMELTSTPSGIKVYVCGHCRCLYVEKL